MDATGLGRFGYVRTGDAWVLPMSRAMRGVLLACALVFFGVAALGFGQADTTGVLVVVALFGGVGVLLLLTALRSYESVDTRRRAFVRQTAFGRSELPFDRVASLRPVRRTLNGTYQGIHVEAVTAADGPGPARSVSPSFMDEAEAAAFEAELRRLMTA